MKIRLFALSALLIAAAPPSAQFALVQSGASDVGAVVDQAVTVVIDSDHGIASFDGQRIHMTQAVLDRVQNRQEARALAALAFAYGSGRIQARGTHKAGVAEHVIALPLYMIAQGATDGRNGAAIPFPDANQNGKDPEEIKSETRQASAHRASLAVHLAERAGSCSGPMVALLNRMRDGDATSAAASGNTESGFARMVLRDLGKQAYPPDNHCAG